MHGHRLVRQPDSFTLRFSGRDTLESMKPVRFVTAIACTLCCVLGANAQTRAAQPPHKPKLVLVIVVDQFRQDYTTRFRSDYTAGLKQLLTGGAVFADAHQDHYPTVTAPGHTTVLTGSVPATSGIIGNEWYDRGSGRTITSVEDANVTAVGDPKAPGASPHNLVVSTVGDELKMADPRAKVFAVSLKDRAAILMGGRMANGAFWFDTNTGGFVSSTWYGDTLPGWVTDFNNARTPDQYAGKQWSSSVHPGTSLVQLPATKDARFYAALEGTPYASEVLEHLAETTMKSEALGQRSSTDLLAVSFSSNDVLGHRLGPDADEVREMSIQTDRIIGRLLNAAIRQAGGVQNLLVVFTADHGVAPLPELNAKRHLPGERTSPAQLTAAIQQRLQSRFGEGKWVVAQGGGGFYLDRALAASHHVKENELEDEAADSLRAIPGVTRVYTRHEFESHVAMGSTIDTYMARGFFAQRSGDVFVLRVPYAVDAASGTSHGTPYDYDSHVPLIFYGWRIHPGDYIERTGVSDIAPTLSFLLSIETPSGSVGHILPVRENR